MWAVQSWVARYLIELNSSRVRAGRFLVAQVGALVVMFVGARVF
jgi:hypothetical protein